MELRCSPLGLGITLLPAKQRFFRLDARRQNWPCCSFSNSLTTPSSPPFAALAHPHLLVIPCCLPSLTSHVESTVSPPPAQRNARLSPARRCSLRCPRSHCSQLLRHLEGDFFRPSEPGFKVGSAIGCAGDTAKPIVDALDSSQHNACGPSTRHEHTVHSAEANRRTDTNIASADISTVKVPEMAESITEGTLKQWSKQVGDYVEQDEEIATIETDKIDVSLNAPQAGTIKEFLVNEEDTVTVGQDVVKLEVGGAAPSGGEKAKNEPKEPASKEQDTASQPSGEQEQSKEQEQKQPEPKKEESKPEPPKQESKPQPPKQESKKASKPAPEEAKQTQPGSRGENRVRCSCSLRDAHTNKMRRSR
jgi:biotin carboxyl carrier protein